MKNTFIGLSALFLLLIAGCGQHGERKKLLGKIGECETKIFGDSLKTIPNQNVGMEAIQAYTDFANAFPDDTTSAEYLFKGAEIAMNLKMSSMAIDYYKRIMDSYPTFSKVAYCLFLQAYILENDLKQYDQAKKVYEDFIKLYPNHVLAKDARLSIQNMGKPIEELIREWEAQKQH